jgi:peptide/nickel transport system ATP-binding protein
MTTRPLLEIGNLRTYFTTPAGIARAVDGISLRIPAGETYALVGESGCGKTLTALSVIGLVPYPAGYVDGGTIRLEGTELVALPEEEKRRLRGDKVSMIFQEPMTSLNPVFTAGYQVAEALVLHRHMSKAEALRASIGILNRVRIPDPERVAVQYPHQLSGGMRQRIMIAIALACRPSLLIADEPTTALDVTIQAQILDLIRELGRESGMSVLLITHNLGLVREIASRVGVMYAGSLVEEAAPADLLHDPAHPYTRMLIRSLPSPGSRGKPLAAIPGSVPPPTEYGTGCRFAGRCPDEMRGCAAVRPAMIETAPGRAVACHLRDPGFAGDRTLVPAPVAAVPPAALHEMHAGLLLDARDVRVHFPVTAGVFKRIRGWIKAVDGASIAIQRGSTVALVGESGCGKTTFGKTILRLVPATSGKVVFDGTEIGSLKRRDFSPFRGRMQMIFQDPYSSLDPRLTVGEIVQEGLLARGESSAVRERAAESALSAVGLGSESLSRYPHEFSGGQRQRIGIARALAVKPSFVVCDEATSALDVSVQAQILNLLAALKNEYGLTYLFITHDLGVVEYFADLVYVMYLGRIVESGTVEDTFASPAHPYTRMLLDAVPRVEGASSLGRKPASGDVPSPVNPPAGCHFHPRCPVAMPRCSREYPAQSRISLTRSCRCHLYPAS